MQPVFVIIASTFLFHERPGVKKLVCAGVAAMFIGTLLGLVVHKKIPADIFGKVIYAIVGIGGIWIIVSHLM